MKKDQKKLLPPLPVAVISGLVKGNENITSSRAMLEYLSELDARAPSRFKVLLDKPRVLHKAQASREQQLEIYELVRRTALINNEYSVCNAWSDLGYSIESDHFSLWKLPESCCEGWVNIKITMITGHRITGPVLFAPAGIWPLAVRIDAERLSSPREETQPDSEESSED